MPFDLQKAAPGLALLLTVPLLALSAQAQANTDHPAQNTTLLVDVDHRHAVSLNGDWHTIVDPYGSGLYDFHGKVRENGYFANVKETAKTGPEDYNFETSPTLKVPGDWNTQRDSLFYYEGPVWYEKDFNYAAKPKTRVFFHVDSANYRSFVWLNGSKACEHEGGFTPFDCEVTALLHDGANFAVVAVDSARLPDGVPALQTDWWNYGGLTGDVSLIEVPEQFIDDYSLSLKRGTSGQLEGWVHVEGAPAGTPVTISIPELKLTTTANTARDGRAPVTLNASSLELWSPEHPKLYKVNFQAGPDELEDDMGFRTVETRGTQILLNGKPIFLRGMSVHAEAPFRTGRAYTEQDMQTLLGWMRELGGNYVRLAHYPHNQRMTRLTDRMGILVWSEIPDYWAIQFDNPVVLAKAQQQLHENIRRDRDKASIILWSIANETPNTPARTRFLTTLAADVHTQDPTRLVTAALLVRTEGMQKIIDDPLGAILDVIGANEYVGWYEHKPEDADNTKWQVNYQKPLIMSEWGGEAKSGLHGDANTRWTEEYQQNLYRHQLVMLNNIPQLRGMSPWILMDFRSPRRVLYGIQDNFNRKGVVSDQGVKKKAFYVLQKAYKEGTVGKAE